MAPLKLSYPCNQCDFEATSARQLSRHKAVTHVKNPLTCILCPFVTAYQTNLLRHRREVHGILGSKGNKSCKFCGFEADDNNTLILHQQQSHQDILKSARERFAREKKSARGLNQTGHSSHFMENLDLNGSVFQEDENKKRDEVNDNDDDKDFWKEGFLDNPPNLLLNYNSSTPIAPNDSNSNSYLNSFPLSNNVNNSSLPVSFENTLLEYSSSRPATPLNAATKMTPAGSQSPSPPDSNGSLAPTKIRRQYSCSDCGFRTVNPREFLYHRRDVHSQKVKIVECPYCVYACQYFQKLQRHMLLVHKLETSMTPPAELLAASQTPLEEEESSSLQCSPKQGYSTFSENDSPNNKIHEPGQIKNYDEPDQSHIKKNNQEKKPEVFSNENSTIDNGQSQTKKKCFQCSSCGYSTHVQYLFKKHLKYHNAPKIKCDLCDFESPYSWNVERHARSHRLNGAYKCLKCNFSSDKPQAITIHVTQHHRDKVIPNVKSDNLHDLNCFDEVSSSTYSNLNNYADQETFEGEVKNETLENENQSSELESVESVNSLLKKNIESNLKNANDQDSIKYSKNVTYFRKADGKIVAKPSISKKCKYCNYQADSISKLQKHETSSHPEKRFQCPLCEIRFENLVWLQRHLMHMHKEDTQADNIVNILEMLRPKKKSSNSCSKSNLKSEVNKTESMNNLSKRPMVNKSRNATVCKVCGYQTRWISELQKHMRVHTKEKPFICPYCSFRSKWKGDLNRHIQKYHSLQPMPDLDAMEKAAIKIFSNQPEWNILSQADSDTDKTGHLNNDSKENVKIEEVDFDNIEKDKDLEETELEIDLRDEKSRQSVSILLKNSEECKVDGDELELSSEKPTKIKIYECCYCDFTCTTASRFHVHFVQHLNTKPFMCSICGHRSNWEWDVTKHIKMKSQRDSQHSEARPVLIHDSGKRDYRKYNKYLIWVNQEDVDSNGMLQNKQDSKTKKLKSEVEDNKNETNEGLNYHQDDNLIQDSNPDYFDAESVVITPDISFAVSNYGSDGLNRLNDETCESYKSKILQPNVPYISTNKDETLKDFKLLYCAYCEYSHRDRKSLVSHMSTHAGRKPYKCRLCSFTSNWKEVVTRHVSSRHNGSSKDVIQCLKYIVNKYICRIIDETGEINPGPEVARPLFFTNNSKSNELNELNEQENDQSIPSAIHHQIKKLKENKTFSPSVAKSAQSSSSSSSSRFSGFKGSYKCSLCPFRAEKSFHMDFHAKRHQQIKGADFKCPHCPYWVNAKKSLTKHIYLHDYESEMVFQNSRFGSLNQEPDFDNQSDYEGDDDQSERENATFNE